MRVDSSLVENSSKRVWKVVFAMTGVAALVWLTGTATFLFDVEDTSFVARVGRFGIKHNCLTGYAIATHLAVEKTENLYVPSHYRNAAISTPTHDSVRGILDIHGFHYPPPFLTLPYVLLAVFGDFFATRAAWFVLTVVCFVGALAGVARWCGAFRSQPRLLIFAVLLCAPTVHVALQIGNAHIIIIAISMLAMVAFEEKRAIIGGALLGFAVVSKIWPVVLVVYLLLQRRWGQALWCGIAVAIYALGAFLLFGPNPYSAFFTYELPRISSGAAFGVMGRLPRPIMTNMSVFGIPQKLHALGLLSSKPELVSPALSLGFTALAGLIVIATGLRGGDGAEQDDSDRLRKAQVWLALLTLVQLGSPFLPWPYGVVSTLWLLVLLLASARGWKRGAIFVAWLCLCINVPPAFLSDAASFHIAYTLLATLLVYGAIMAGIGAYWMRFGWLHAPCRAQEK
jgi:hypothetical protein